MRSFVSAALFVASILFLSSPSSANRCDALLKGWLRESEVDARLTGFLQDYPNVKKRKLYLQHHIEILRRIHKGEELSRRQKMDLIDFQLELTRDGRLIQSNNQRERAQSLQNWLLFLLKNETITAPDSVDLVLSTVFQSPSMLLDPMDPRSPIPELQMILKNLAHRLPQPTSSQIPEYQKILYLGDIFVGSSGYNGNPVLANQSLLFHYLEELNLIDGNTISNIREANLQRKEAQKEQSFDDNHVGEDSSFFVDDSNPDFQLAPTRQESPSLSESDWSPSGKLFFFTKKELHRLDRKQRFEELVIYFSKLEVEHSYDLVHSNKKEAKPITLNALYEGKKIQFDPDFRLVFFAFDPVNEMLAVLVNPSAVDVEGPQFSPKLEDAKNSTLLIEIPVEELGDFAFVKAASD